MFRQPIHWRDVDKLRRDMDKLFENSLPRWPRQRATSYPAINVWRNNDEGVLVTAELPGLNPEDLNISVTGDTLTLSGHRQHDTVAESAQFQRQERAFGEFNRSFQLPFTVNTAQVEATIENGNLRIILPRAEAEKPRQISVRSMI